MGQSQIIHLLLDPLFPHVVSIGGNLYLCIFDFAQNELSKLTLKAVKDLRMTTTQHTSTKEVQNLTLLIFFFFIPFSTAKNIGIVFIDPGL